MIKKYDDWLNEGVDPDVAIEKTTPQFEAWAKSLNLKYETDIPGYVKGARYYVTIPHMGLWILMLEEGRRSTGRQDSMYRPQYEDSGNYKWYMKYPCRYSQYSPRQGYLTGNFKSFKEIIERVMVISEVFEKVYEFIKLLGVDEENLKNFSAEYNGKNQKDLYVSIKLPLGNIFVQNVRNPDYKITTIPKIAGSYSSSSLDANKGELYYYVFLACKLKLKLKKLDIIEDILEALKDKPVEKVWETIKSGDWEKIGNDTRGLRTSKRFGL